MIEDKDLSFKVKKLILVVLLVLIALKSYQHFKPRDLISIIGDNSIESHEEVNIDRYNVLSSATYDLHIDDIDGLIQLLKSIKVRRFFIGDGEVRYEGHMDHITFNNNKRIVNIRIIGDQYIWLHIFPDDISYNNYKIIGDIDTSLIDRIIDKNVRQENDK